MLWTALYRCWHIGCEMQLALPNARTTLNEKKKNSTGAILYSLFVDSSL